MTLQLVYHWESKISAHRLQTLAAVHGIEIDLRQTHDSSAPCDLVLWFPHLGVLVEHRMISGIPQSGNLERTCREFKELTDKWPNEKRQRALAVICLAYGLRLLEELQK